MQGLLKKGNFLGRMVTSSQRMLPSFLIIGGRRCGTTSLFNYIIEHPCIEPPLKKEIHYFHNSFKKGLSWYKGFFPKKPSKSVIYKNQKYEIITGEASADYIFHPLAPKRISETLPSVKLIALLRDPVERSYSDYQLAVSGGHEKLSFEDAIQKEKERTEGEIEKILAENDYYSFNLWHYAYKYQSRYAEQLKNWFKFFSKKEIFLLKSEDLFSKPELVVKQVFDFLGSYPFSLSRYEKFNSGNYTQMKDETRKNLVDYFKPHNEELYKLSGRDFGWDNQ